MGVVSALCRYRFLCRFLFLHMNLAHFISRLGGAAPITCHRLPLTGKLATSSMDKIVDMAGAVRVRLSPAQIDIIAPGISLLVQSHRERLRSGSSPLAYRFRIYPPPTGFDRGTYDQEFMDQIIASVSH